MSGAARSNPWTRLRVGIVGAGKIGERRARVAMDYVCTPVVAVADIDGGRAEALANSLGIETVTTDWRCLIDRSDIEAIVVATTHQQLGEISEAAIRSGKHVLCEKPLGRSSQEVRDAVEVSRASRLVYKTGFNNRHHPAVREAHRLVSAGEIGRPYFARCRYGHGGRPGYDREWRANVEAAGGGELLDQGVHTIDLFRWFLGKLSSVYGFVETYFWDIAPLEDNAFANFRTTSGQIASLHVSWTH